MAAQLDIPIVVVDVTRCAELELQKVQDMLNLVKEQNRMDLIPEILQKIENNRISTLGELKEIRKEIFSEKIVNETLEEIISKIKFSDIENFNMGIHEFVKATNKIKQVYKEQDDFRGEECKTYNYDEYIDRLKTLYTARNGLDEDGNVRKKETIISNLPKHEKNEQEI